MSDERNADSVLFRVENLREAAQAQVAARQAEGGTTTKNTGGLARLAAPAPSSGGSGLIDIKKIAEAAAAPAAPSPSPTSTANQASAVAPPPSGAPIGSLISTDSMLGGPPVSTQAQPASAPSRTPLLILSVLVVLALGGVIAAIAMRGI